MQTQTITIPKTQYQELKTQAKAYKQIMTTLFKQAIKNPVSQVVDDFRNTKLYSKEFIQDLEDGLNKSSYSSHYGNQSPS